MIFNGRIAVSAVMLAIFAGMVAMASAFPVQGRFLPFVIGIPGIVLCLAQLIIDVTQARRAAPSASEIASGAVSEERDEIRREVKMFGWLAAFFAGILLFGFLIGGPVLLFAFLRFAERESLYLSLGAALAGLVVMYGMFVRVLGLTIFEGFLIQAIF
ncbi:MAG TPA: tripartite tricarboxylate transporter TctB family protein [Kiloniellales bacterium]|nr:tripartite tricarboxylate transporter TctB family protein [Kiloniellales bacterium]